MKNIHVLPTEKPSRLFDDGIELYLGELKDRKGHPVTSYNIYITSDEEIKEGDWFYLDMSHSNTLPDEIHQMGNDKWSKTGGIHFCEGNTWVDSCKKIILTTDQDLIKDGVQAIDDEFLEWFIKNENCEEVELMSLKEIGRNEYEIILLEKETLEECFLKSIKNVIQFGNDAQAIRLLEKYFEAKKQTKQETLEEASPMRELIILLDKIKKNLTNKTEILTIQLIVDTVKNQFIEKEIKWQQQRSYSDLSLCLQNLADKDRLKSLTSNQIRTAIEQFKKK